MHLYIKGEGEYADTDENDFDQGQNWDQLVMENISEVIVHIDENYKFNHETEKIKVNRFIDETVCPLCRSSSDILLDYLKNLLLWIFRISSKYQLFVLNSEHNFFFLYNTINFVKTFIIK